MNGRIYDPVLGMFISPDNYLQSPTQSQNFNRYSYAMGNPLKYTDPDGNFFFIMAIGYALMQADIAGNASKNNGGDYWSGFGRSAGVSAISMAVGFGVGSWVGSFMPTGTGALGSTLSGAASGALSGGITGGVMNGFMGGSFKSGFINGAIGGGIMGALGGYMKYAESNAIQEVLGEGKVDGDLTTYKTMGQNYDNSYAVEANDMTLCEDYRYEMDVFEGRGGINTITTRAQKYGMTVDGDYVNLRTSNIVKGYWDPKNGALHVSANYSAAKNLTSFRDVAGHEYIHSYHSFYNHNNKTQSERVAYKYSYDVYNKAGMTNIATAIKNMAITKGFWGASDYHLPPSFNSFTFK